MSNVEEFLKQFATFSVDSSRSIGLGPFVVLLLASLLSSLIVTFLYLRFYGSRETGSEVYLSFPVLGVSITAIFLTIQFSLPLSLGLLGALSIVRFRTPIKAPEEVGFIMLLVASSLACATFNLPLLGLILLVGLLALLVRRSVPGLRAFENAGEASALVGLANETYATRGGEILELAHRSLHRCALESVTESEREVVLTFRFRDRPERSVAFSAALRELATPTSFSVIFHRPGAW